MKGRKYDMKKMMSVSLILCLCAYISLYISSYYVNETYMERVQDIEINPRLEISDDTGVWKSHTSINLFDSLDDNIKKDGETLIAPGTKNTYTLKIKNTGDTAMDYQLNITFDVDDNQLRIPLKVRLKRYDKIWLLGNYEYYSSIYNINNTKDTYTLGKGRYSYYTLEWVWPYETQDEYDTYLGNLALSKDIVLNINIEVVSSISDDINALGGILVDTADHNPIFIYICMFFLSLGMMIYINNKWKKVY